MNIPVNERQLRLFYLTRRPSFLWKLVLGTLGAGVIGGFLVNALSPSEDLKAREMVREMIAPLPPQWQDDDEDVPTPGKPQPAPDTGAPRQTPTDPPAMEDAVIRRLTTDWAIAGSFARRMQVAGRHFLAGSPEVRKNVGRLIEETFAENSDQQVTMTTLLAVLDRGNVSPEEKPSEPDALLALAEADDPPQGAFAALGVYWELHFDYRKAAQYYAQVRPPDEEFGREKAVDLYLLLQDYGALRELARDPLFADHLELDLQWRIATRTYDWPRIIRLVVPVQYYDLEWISVLLVGIAALVWWLILMRLGQVRRPDIGTLWLSLAGFLLGVASTWLTILLILYQEQSWGLDGQFTGIIEGFLYCIAGIGLREEFAKWLLFLPLVPILLKRNNDLEMLIVAGSVGLGFAAEENLGYVQGLNLAAGSRFVTANFFHIVLTGSIGYAFCRAVRSPARHLSDFFGVFTLMVIAHGVYNGLMMIPELVMQGAGYFSMTVFIYLSWQFFTHVHNLRTPQGGEPISTTSIFLFGLSLLLAVTLVALCFVTPLGTALQVMALMSAETGLICIMYLREFREITEV